MREFILRARKGPTTPDFVLEREPPQRHLEIIAHCVVNALFYSARIRDGVRLQIVLDGPAAPPKIIRLESDQLGSLEGLDERSVWRVLQRALGVGRELTLGEECESQAGVYVAKGSFEQLVRSRCESRQVYYLKPNGDDLHAVEWNDSPCFVFTDHLAMPRKTDRFMERLGARPLSVGPRMLYASQCIAVVQNELDRQGLD
jgi:tRNA (pseudouridine54-N1)-methyltransferase